MGSEPGAMALPARNLDALRTFQEFGVDAQFLGQRFVEAQELRRGDSYGADALVERLRQAGIAVIERNGPPDRVAGHRSQAG